MKKTLFFIKIVFFPFSRTEKQIVEVVKLEVQESTIDISARKEGHVMCLAPTAGGSAGHAVLRDASKWG